MLMNAWYDGIEITDEMKTAGNSFESYITNCFLRVKDLKVHPSITSPGPGDARAVQALESAQKKIDEALRNSFDTALGLRAIQDLVSEWNNSTRRGIRRGILHSRAMDNPHVSYFWAGRLSRP
jgi:cysteinyl-tRNA synthetase